MRESNDNRIGTRMGEDCRIWRESEWILPRKVADGQNRPGTRQIPIVRGGKLPSKTTIWRWWKEKSIRYIIRYIKQGCPETWVHCKQLSWIKVVRVELCWVVLQSDCCDAVALGWVKKWRLTELNWQAQPFCTCAEILSVLRLWDMSFGLSEKENQFHPTSSGGYMVWTQRVPVGANENTGQMLEC